MLDNLTSSETAFQTIPEVNPWFRNGINSVEQDVPYTAFRNEMFDGLSVKVRQVYITIVSLKEEQRCGLHEEESKNDALGSDSDL